MRCKAGDLAIVVRSNSGENLGKVVRCLRIANAEDMRAHRVIFDRRPMWVIEGTLTGRDVLDPRHSAEVPIAPDDILRPLRGDDDAITNTFTTDREVAA